MAKPQSITVESLYYSLAAQIAKGNGKKKIMVMDDDEGNGMHPIYFAVTPLDDCDLDYINVWGVDKEDVKKNYVLIG